MLGHLVQFMGSSENKRCTGTTHHLGRLPPLTDKGASLVIDYILQDIMTTEKPLTYLLQLIEQTRRTARTIQWSSYYASKRIAIEVRIVHAIFLFSKNWADTIETLSGRAPTLLSVKIPI